MFRFAILIPLLLAAFALIASLRGECHPFNESVLQYWRANRTENLTTLAIGFARLGNNAGVALLTIAAVAVLLIRRQRPAAILLALVLIFGCGLNVLLKVIFEEPRPAAYDSPWPAGGYSFPSGHAQAAVGLYCTLAVLARRWIVMIGSAIPVAGICWCRLYLGVHWPTDVLAGLVVGAFALTVGILTVRLTTSVPSAPLPLREGLGEALGRAEPSPSPSLQSQGGE